jgi:hypothetical protein
MASRPPIDVVWTNDFVPLRSGCMACDDYPSVIRLYAWRSAGVIDVSAIILLITILASRLCARIILPRPCEMLSYPLMGTDLPIEVDWDRYYTTQYRPNRGPMWTRDNSTSAKRKAVPAGTFGTQLTTALAMAEAGVPFEWQLISDFQDQKWSERNLTTAILSYGRSCTDNPTVINQAPDFSTGPISLAPSESVEALAASLRSEHDLVNGAYVAMHIRRGDAMGVCNDTISGIVDYVTCTLANATADEPIVIFTDERDRSFLAALTGNMSSAFDGRRRIIHAPRRRRAQAHRSKRHRPRANLCGHPRAAPARVGAAADGSRALRHVRGARAERELARRAHPQRTVPRGPTHVRSHCGLLAADTRFGRVAALVSR